MTSNVKATTNAVATAAAADGAAAADKYDPIVIVTSLGAVVRAEDIINNIRQVPFADDQLPLAADHFGLRYTVVTKYYTSNVLFVRYDKPLDTLPPKMQAAVEGILVYFDAENREILKQIDDHLKFAKNNGLQLLMLMCDKLYDDARLGMTYKEVKHCTQMFIDIIELGRTRDDDDEDDDDDGVAINPTATLTTTGDDDDDEDDEDDDDADDKDHNKAAGKPTVDHHDPVGYAELLQVLQNNIWSNVNMAAALRGIDLGDGADDSDSINSDFQRELTDFMKATAPTTAGKSVLVADASDKQFVQEVADLIARGGGGDIASIAAAAAASAASQAPDVGVLHIDEKGSTKAPAAGATARSMEHRVDAELLNFEKLLTNLMAFRENSTTLSRNERFAYTANFADAFDQMIGDGPDDSGDDDGDDSETTAAS